MRALVVTNMYPTPERPALGSFVRDQVEALRRRDDVEIELFAFPPGPRAYPEAAAYAGTPVPYQGQPTLDAITLKPGQKYVLADKTVPTDYYRATSFNNQLPGDGTVIRGQEQYYQVRIGHRFGYVKVADVAVLTGGRR